MRAAVFLACFLLSMGSGEQDARAQDCVNFPPCTGCGCWTGGLGQNGWGAGYLGQYNMVSAFVFEAVATFLFMVCILGVTQKGAPSQFAGLAIGMTLVVIHIVGINVTGVSVNPARSLGPAIVGMATNAAAVSQVWLFIVAPLLGAGVAGLLFRPDGLLTAEE